MSAPTLDTKPGDVVTLDSGYGGETFADEECTVIQLGNGHTVFGNPIRSLFVRHPDGSTFWTDIPNPSEKPLSEAQMKRKHL